MAHQDEDAPTPAAVNEDAKAKFREALERKKAANHRSAQGRGTPAPCTGRRRPDRPSAPSAGGPAPPEPPARPALRARHLPAPHPTACGAGPVSGRVPAPARALQGSARFRPARVRTARAGALSGACGAAPRRRPGRRRS
ncbi:DUF5302 domain-containing protein [Cellulomonas sp. ATA003]|uniref:DUF5302 domain-containing protein n=1 Tax=Cellulomonas sp. ATA003 TaxID=3073064 RepID=UPI0037BFFE52